MSMRRRLADSNSSPRTPHAREGEVATIIITKSSNLERIGATVKTKVDQGLVPSSVYEAFEVAHDQHYATLAALKAELTSHGVRFREAGRSDAIDLTGIRAVFSVGGDGTLLAATDSVDGRTPVIGIKSSDSSIGYLCAADAEHIPETVTAFCQGRLSYTPRPRMAAEIYHDRGDSPSVITPPVLNDFLFANSHPAATSRYVLRVGSAEEDHKSSGIWLATPSGSTAGIMAAGGEQQDSVSGAFQYLVREMYAGDEVARKLRGGTFVPGVDRIEIINLNPEGILALDGSRLNYDLHMGSMVRFVAAEPALVAAPIALTP